MSQFCVGFFDMDIFRQSFMVDDKPYAIQGTELKDFEEQYIKDLDPAVWRYTLDKLPTKVEDMSYLDALELRRSVSQNIETVLALLFAVLQTRYCVTGWLSFYQMSDLRRLIEKVESDQSFHNRFNLTSFSWEDIASVLWPTFTEERQNLSAKSLKQMADFLNSRVDADEYNALKHGMRLQKSSFSASFAPSDDPTTRPSKEEYIHLGSAKFGSSYLKFERIGSDSASKKVNRLGKIHMVNWDLNLLLYLAAHTYGVGHNLIAFLQHYWSIVDQPQYGHFEDPQNYDPKKDPSYGVSSATFNREYDCSQFLQTKDDVENSYTK